MTENYPLVWDKTGEKLFRTGVSKTTLFPMNDDGTYGKGVAWNGVTSISLSPEGGEVESQYADNVEYLAIPSDEKLNFSINAYTYPDEFAVCDGTSEVAPGVSVGQQPRKRFGLCFRTEIGNDTQLLEHGYELVLIYNALAAPSEMESATINDSPEAAELSWECSTSKIAVEGKKPIAKITINSTKADASKLKTFEEILYGKDATSPKLPLPSEVFEHFKKAPSGQSASSGNSGR